MRFSLGDRGKNVRDQTEGHASDKGSVAHVPTYRDSAFESALEVARFASISTALVGYTIKAVSILFFLLLSPVYYLNRWDFKRHGKANPFYTSRLVRLQERYPALYELAMWVQNFPIPHRVYAALPDFSGDVLQVGCGTGLLNKHLANRADIRLTNLDSNLYALRFGAALNRYTAYVHARIDKATPLPDDSFDVIVFARCFHHVRNHKKCFQECSRLLREGGQIIILDPVPLQRRYGPLGQAGYMANSSIDGLIWRLTPAAFEQHVRSRVPSTLHLTSLRYKRQLHITNYNAFSPHTDVVATIEKRSSPLDREAG